MTVKSFLKLIHRAWCVHPQVSEPLKIRLDYRHRQWGIRAQTSRVSYICHCTKCGKMFGQYAESTVLESRNHE